jgi:hypothetical protein
VSKVSIFPVLSFRNEAASGRVLFLTCRAKMSQAKGDGWASLPIQSAMIPAMRAYKFLNAHFGLKSLYEKRLKISTIDDLNDPFELLPYNLSDPKHRWAVHETRKQLAVGRGLLCFSADWRNPVVWAHYADKHKGLCIGFEIPKGRNIIKVVKYVSKRLPFPVPPKIADAEAMLFTKFSSWRYERELRIWAALNDEQDGLYYSDFDNTLRLVEVIAGARCTVPRSAVVRALGPLQREIVLTKARAGFTRFEVVPDKRGFN